jgi:prepilin-type N-terminal cleavage/methylation domain-containing protein
MIKRGFTLVELIFTVAIGSLIIGAAASLYGFVAIRTADSLIKYNAINDSQTLFGELARQLPNATKVDIIPIAGGNKLRLTMPQNAVDSDNDGIGDNYFIIDVNRLHREVWGTGLRIWYYTSDATGNPNNTGRFVFRATRWDNANITSADIDQGWSLLRNMNPRVYIPGGVNFINDIPNRTTSVQCLLQSNSEHRDRSSPVVGTRGIKSLEITLFKRFYWRGYDPS